jgi:hypothetical protein
MNDKPKPSSAWNLKFAAGALVFLAWAAVVSFGLRDWHDEYLVGERAEATTGTVFEIERNNHGQFDYEYSVGGATFRGGQVIAGSPRLSVGDKIRVCYDPLNPSRSTLTTFGEVGARPIPLLLLTILAVVVFLRLQSFLDKYYEPLE